MAFHEVDRVADAGRGIRVKQRLHGKGVDRWRPYAKHLRELTDALRIDTDAAIDSGNRILH
jgi:hypothetical protein